MENSELITKALTYIRSENKKSDITIDDVASHAGFSTDYFNRVFFAHTGFNIMEYVRFSRLKKAAHLLRQTNSDILDIALDCGYEAHESFSRAFKIQYGMSPSEYRKKYEKVEAVYGDFYNDTIGARLLHEFKDFKLADSDEVIDYLLETDALRYGYTAICFRVNGGAALYSGKDFRDGFVWFTEWDNRDNRFEGEIICNDWDKIAEYKKVFSDQRFDMVLYTLESDEIIRAELAKRGVSIQSIQRHPQNIYVGEPYALAPIEDISMKLIKYEDFGLVENFFSQRYPGRGSNSPRLRCLKHELYQRDVIGNTEHSVFMFGIFKGERLIGVSDGGLQRAHGFVINNCIVTSALPEYETETLYQYAFKFVTNAALEKGALPIDDVQIPNTPDENRSGAFHSTDLGYITITNVCILK
ncbi:MAG: helix-turn-helix transcriptional regulator [Clostridia bacterium]|nr:helix-turn-helix transcriptional regulator [Clostridia bacterium]